ncbi:hypothetical protein ACFS07_30260 [Undibacterium arcticum]
MILSAGLAGTGVALIQALMPGVIKHHYPTRIPVTMGLYSAAIMGGGGLGGGAESIECAVVSRLARRPGNLGLAGSLRVAAVDDGAQSDAIVDRRCSCCCAFFCIKK